MAKIILSFGLLFIMIHIGGALGKSCYVCDDCKDVPWFLERLKGSISKTSCYGNCFKMAGTVSGKSVVVRGCQNSFEILLAPFGIGINGCGSASLNVPGVGHVKGHICTCNGHLCNGAANIRNGTLWIPALIVVVTLGMVGNWF